MDIRLDPRLAARYTSPAQKIRVISESWAQQEVFCAACGGLLRSAPNNQRVLDFSCLSCQREYELKSVREAFARKVLDGAYRSMMERLQSNQNPNFFFLAYDFFRWEVINFFVVPGHFFSPAVIERRKPLAKKARRAGWVGCNILLDQIPESGRIHYIKDRKAVREKEVLNAWKKTSFLGELTDSEERSWRLDLIWCVETIDKPEFSLSEVYAFEKELKKRHPKNNTIKDKIRQELQKLRDKNFIEFKGRGQYRRVPPTG